MLFVALVACGGASPPTVSVAPPPSILPRAAPPVTPPVADVCATVLEEQRTALRESVARDRKASPDQYKDVHDDGALVKAALDASGTACFAFRGGAWSLELQGELHVDPLGKNAHGSLVAVARIGASREEAPTALEIGFGVVSAELAGDYDGDGVPEFYVDLHTMGPEGGESDDATIYTVDGHGKVVQYAPSASIDLSGAPFDADGDGRLDLPTSDKLALFGEATCEYWKNYGTTVPLLAHALPDGTFSIDDAVAKAWARKSCPTAPPTIGSTQDALCARLWATTPAEVTAARARVTSSCVQWDCDLEQKHKAQPRGATHDCDARKDTFDQAAPFTLP